MKGGKIVLVENQIILTYWHPRNKEHLESKGYKYTHTGDPVYVKLEDMKKGSKCKVKVICDFCGKEIVKTYKDYNRQRKTNPIDCCDNCHGEKSKITNQEKYGGNSPACSVEVRNKMSNTFKEKYGWDWISKAPEIKQKKKETNLLNYGVENASQAEEVKLKIKRTCMEKYGGPSSQNSLEVRRKTIKTLTNNNGVYSSKPEREMVLKLKEIYGEENCFPQYPLDLIVFDCLIIVNGVKIDVEFDGTYWHKDTHKDIKRDYFTFSNGIKVLRFKGDYVAPSKEQIIQSVDYLVNNEHRHLIVNI